MLRKLSEKGWRDIAGYEGLYQVHKKGYVRNADGLVMKTYENNSGYLCIKLRKNGKSKSFLLHRLVAIAWVKNKKPDVFTIVNHEDGDKHNCFYKNLVWCDNSYNILHARRTGLNPYNKPTVGKKFGNSSKYHGVTWDKSRNKWRAYIRHNNKYWFQRRFDTEKAAARHYNWILDELGLTDRPRNKFMTKEQRRTTIKRLRRKYGLVE